MPVETAQVQQVRTHFERVAGTYASFYEGATSESHSFNTRLRRVLDMLPADVGTLVDIGCGPGLLLQCVEERQGDRSSGMRLIGMDFAPKMVQEADRLVNAPAVSRRASFVCGDAAHLPFESRCVDTAVCMGLMEYLDDEASVLRELSRIVRRHGQVIITLPNRWSPYRVWHRLLNRLFGCLRAVWPHSQRLKDVEFMVGPFTKGIAHREYSERAYRRLLRRFAFEPVEICYYNFKLCLSPLDKRFPRMTVALSRALEPLGRTPFVRCLATAFIIKARRV